MSTVTLGLEGLAFAHGDARPLFSGLTGSLGPGFTGLVGENGAGKTTLLRLLAGDLAPTAGQVRLRPAGATVALCPQSVEAPTLDIRALAAQQDGEARRLIGQLELPPGPVERWTALSPGERKRWQIAAALATAPDVLLLDEPTNHADARTRAVLATASKDFPGTGVIVSHDRALLQDLCHATLRLAHGEGRLYALPYEAAQAVWNAERQAAERERDGAQQAAREAMRQLADARRARAAAEHAMSGRRRVAADHDARSAGAKTLRAWAESRRGGDVARLKTAAARARAEIPEVGTTAQFGRSVFAGYVPAPRPVILSLDAPELRVGERLLARDVRVSLRRGERIRLAGPNGAGKSTLLRALTERAGPDPAAIFYLRQETSTAEAAAIMAMLRALDPTTRGRVCSLVAALGTDPARVMDSPRPSPGELRRVQLALGLGRHVWALVLDEPTNHLDLPTLERLEPALASFPGALLLVSHDDTFAAACATTTWRLEGGRLRVE